MADQLKLDIQITGGQQAQQQLAALAQQVQSFPSAAQGATTGATQLGQAVTQAGQAASQAHPAYVSLGSVIGNLPGPLGQTGSAFAALTVQITQAQQGMLALAGVSTAIGTGIAAGLGAAVGEAAQFQKTFAEVAVVSQASAEHMDELRQKAIQLGASSTFNSQQVAAGLRELLQAGLTVTETLQGIEPATRAAMIAGQSLDQTTTMIAHTMRQFGMDAGQIPHIVDAMTVAAQASTLKFSEFGNLFENLRGRTQNLGIPFEEVTALLITMVNAGVPAAAASTALGTAMDRLGKATKTGSDEASQGIRALGLNVWDTQGKFVGFTALLQQIQDRLPTMTQQERVHAEALLGGSRASGAFNLTLQQQNKVMVDGQEVTLKGTDLIRAYTAQLEHADGVSERASETIGATLAIQWQRFNSSVQESAIQLGTAFIPAVSSAMPPITGLVNAFVNASPEMHNTAAALLAVGAATATMGGLVLGGTVALAALGPAIGAAVVSAGLLLPAIAAVGAAVGLLAAAWINDWGNIRETTEAGVTAAAGALGQFQADLEGVRQWLAQNPLVITVKRVVEGQGGVEADPAAARGTAEKVLADQQALAAQLEASQQQTITDIAGFWARGFSQIGGTVHTGIEALGVRLHDSGPSLGQSLQNGLAEARFGEHLEAALTDDQMFMRLLAAANRIGDALTPALADAVGTSLDNPVIHAEFTDWGAKVASEVGAALQANKGNVQKALTDFLSVEPNAALQDVGVQQILERANALKAVEQVLNTLTPVERSHYEIQLLANGADDKANQTLAVLTDMRDKGTITQEQYNNAIERGSTGLDGQKQKHEAVKSALEQHNEALQKLAGSTDLTTAANAKATQALDKLLESEAKRFGGAFAGNVQALIAQNRETEAAAQIEDRLGVAYGTLAAAADGVAVAERDLAHARDLAKEAALGGAVAVRDYTDGLERERLAALGGALAVRDHDEALTREKEAALGGAVAVRDHNDALQRQHDQALGGAVAIRTHEEALQREKEAALGGLLAIQSHADALQRQHDAALGGALGIRAHSEALDQEKVAALGGYQAIQDHQAALQNDKDAALHHTGVMRDLANVIETVSLANQHNTINTAAGTAAIDDYRRAIMPTLAVTKTYTDELLRQAGVFDELAKASGAAGDLQHQYLQAETAQALRAQAAGAASEALRNAPNNGIGPTRTGGGSPSEGAAPTPAVGNDLSRQVGDAAADAAKLAVTLGQDVGHALDTGVSLGLEAGGAAVSTKLSEIVTAAIDQAKKDLGIASPSLVAAQTVGAPIAQGIAAGMSQNVTLIETAAQALAKAATNEYGQMFANMKTVNETAQQYLLNSIALFTGVIAQSQDQVDTAWASMKDRQQQALADAVNARYAYLHGEGPEPRGTVAGSDQGVAFPSALGEWERVRGFDAGGQPFGAATRGAAGLAQAYQGVGTAAEHMADATVAAMAYMTQAIDQTAEQARKSWGEALQAGQLLIAGMKTAVGLTYGQIYGQTATQGTATQGTGTTGLVGTLGTPGAYQNLLPGNYGGVPVIDPLTAGTLRGYASGGLLTQPTILVNQLTGRAYGRAAENGPEWVGPGGGGGTSVSLTVNVNGADALRDPRLYEQLLDRGLTQAMRKRGLVAA